MLFSLSLGVRGQFGLLLASFDDLNQSSAMIASMRRFGPQNQHPTQHPTPNATPTKRQRKRKFFELDIVSSDHHASDTPTPVVKKPRKPSKKAARRKEADDGGEIKVAVDQEGYGHLDRHRRSPAAASCRCPLWGGGLALRTSKPNCEQSYEPKWRLSTSKNSKHSCLALVARYF